MIYYRDWKDAIRSDFAGKYWSWAHLRVNLSKYPDQEQDLIDSSIIRIVPVISIKSVCHKILEWLFESIRDGKTVRMKRLHIINRTLHVAPDIVAEAVMKLETLTAYLSSTQVKAILTRLATTENSKLNKLTVFNFFHFNTMDPEVLAIALIKLKSVGMDLSSSLSPNQLTVLFYRIKDSENLILRNLDMINVNISIVPPEVLLGAIQRLREVHFIRGRMTEEQATAIITLAKERRLGRIKLIRFSNVVGMSSVSSSLLQEAKFNNQYKLLWIV